MGVEWVGLIKKYHTAIYNIFWNLYDIKNIKLYVISLELFRPSIIYLCIYNYCGDTICFLNDFVCAQNYYAARGVTTSWRLNCYV